MSNIWDFWTLDDLKQNKRRNLSCCNTRQGKANTLIVQTASGVHWASYLIGTRFFFWFWSCCDVKVMAYSIQLRNQNPAELYLQSPHDFITIQENDLLSHCLKISILIALLNKAHIVCLTSNGKEWFINNKLRGTWKGKVVISNILPVHLLVGTDEKHKNITQDSQLWRWYLNYRLQQEITRVIKFLLQAVLIDFN